MGLTTILQQMALAEAAGEDYDNPEDVPDLPKGCWWKMILFVFAGALILQFI